LIKIKTKMKSIINLIFSLLVIFSVIETAKGGVITTAAGGNTTLDTPLNPIATATSSLLPTSSPQQGTVPNSTDIPSPKTNSTSSTSGSKVIAG
jgi:hypothetical protein